MFLGIFDNFSPGMLVEVTMVHELSPVRIRDVNSKNFVMRIMMCSGKMKKGGV
jgi:hypothetical protein